MKKMETAFIGLKGNFCNGYNHVKMLSAEHINKDDLKKITDFERQIAEYTRQIYECLYVDEPEVILDDPITFLLKNGTEKVIPEDMIQALVMEYGSKGINVRNEIRKMSDWTHDKKNASKRKTDRGTNLFIRNWLRKAAK